MTSIMAKVYIHQRWEENMKVNGKMELLRAKEKAKTLKEILTKGYIPKI